MAKYRVKDEKLKRMRLGSRYFGFNLAQFYWECLKSVAASEGLTETDLLRRIIRSWSETLPSAVREKARAETTRLEAWKAHVLSGPTGCQTPAKQARLRYKSTSYHRTLAMEM
jgi:predicted DNA-binding ribbon-helix-helix protein